jgi:hypothetical protein
MYVVISHYFLLIGHCLAPCRDRPYIIIANMIVAKGQQPSGESGGEWGREERREARGGE